MFDNKLFVGEIHFKDDHTMLQHTLFVVDALPL